MTTALTDITASDLSVTLYQPVSFTIERPFARQILLLQTNVAGCGHVPEIKKYLREIKKGSRLVLSRMPENPYDEKAIPVITEKGNRIGYIPRHNNTVIANLMDAGKSVYAVVDHIKRDKNAVEWNPWNLIMISVYMED